MVVTAVLFTIVAFVWAYFLWSRRKYYAFALKMPGPIGFPFIGVAHKFFNSADILFNFPKYCIKYNVKTYFFWLGTYPMLYTIDPKIIEIILNSPDCLDKCTLYDVISDIVGPGILTIKAPTWNHHRKIINPAFSHKVLLGFFPLFKNNIGEFCEELEQNVGCGEIDMKKLICNLAIKTSVGTTLGLDFADESSTDFLETCEILLEITARRAMSPLLSNSTIFRATKMYSTYKKLKAYVQSFLHNLVMKRVKAFEQNGLEDKSKPNIFLDHVIKSHQNNEYTFDEIISEGNIMLFAAFETTASSMYSTLMLLAMHPQYQQKVFEEILTVFPDKDFDVKYQDLKKLEYLEMCINETLRIFTPIPLIGRNPSKDIHISKDIIIPAGTQLVIDIFNIHRDEDIWGPDATAFNPDHFLPSNRNEQHSYSFIPFSRGQRNCLGWQYAKIFLKIALVKVIRNYWFSTKFKFQDIKCSSQITLVYKTNPHLEVHRR